MTPLFKFFITRARRLFDQGPYLRRYLALAWKTSPRLCSGWLALVAIQGFLPFAVLLSTRNVVDRLVEHVRATGDRADLAAVFAAVAGLIAALFAERAAALASSVLRDTVSDRLVDVTCDLVHAKASSVDMEFYDRADFYDHLHRACIEANFRPREFLAALESVAQSAIMLGLLGIGVSQYGWWVVLVLLVSALPAFLAVARSNAKRHEWNKKATPLERWSWYYGALLTQREFASEMRLFDLSRRTRDADADIRRQLRTGKLNLALRDGALAAMGMLLAFSLCAAASTWVVWLAASGEATLGEVVFVYQAFLRGQQVAHASFRHLGQLYGNSLFLSSLFEFLDLSPVIRSPAESFPVPAPLKRGIEFEGVTFRYPGCDQAVLQDFHLTIPAGQLVAVVGLNGAGKSTLVKLVCRFYDPEAGRITLDGIDLRSIDLGGLRNAITVLMQEPVAYCATARENVETGSKATPSSGDLRQALCLAGATEVIDRLPEGLETHLGKGFGLGTDLSVGQWQRLALARAFLRASPIVLLDEPTSALDSWSEILWLDRLREAVAGKTVLLITHRFSTARLADRICVMMEGKIVESGTHEELLRSSGAYADAWAKQVRS